MSFEIYLLGQFKLKANDLMIELPSRPAQSLLAYLALNAGATLRREKLASLLWSEATETNARGYLRQALWRIRKSLESGGVSWEDYLRISEISVTFERQSDYWLDVDQLLRMPEGRPLAEIIEEVRLYRGELLPGFYDGWVGLERDRLQTAYFQKMNFLLEHLTQARRWDEALEWGEQWILHGFSPEPAYRALMKAYAGLGNPGMVSATYQRCVEALSRDLDVEPSSETKRLYEQLQAGEPTIYHSNALPEVEHTDKSPFLIEYRGLLQVEKSLVVARERELGRLNGYLSQAIEGRGRVIFVTGEAGSGKTTLLNELIRRAQIAHPDLIVASGNCNAHTGMGDPFQPFREILELLSGDVRARWSAGAISKEYAQFLWDLMPVTAQALVDAGPDLINTFISGVALFERAMTYATGEADWLVQLDRLVKRKMADPMDHNPHQADLFIQYSKLLQSLARHGPLVLVLDDLQWADLGSVSLLFHLGRLLAGNRILIVGAYRPEEIALGRAGARHPLEPVLNELQREQGDIEVNLDQVDCRVFVEALLDSEPNRLGRQFREMLCDLTRGHPLFTIELLRGMQERGDLVRDELGRWVEGPALDWDTLPARVEAVIAERIGRLEPSVQATLRIASVEGELFTAEVVARVRAREDSEILSCLSNDLDRNHRLVRAQSIQRIGGQFLSSYRFRHILVQKYLYQSMDEIEKVYTHARVGEVLEQLYANQVGTVAGALQLARHYQEARISEKAIHYLHQAGQRALQMSGYQEASAHLERGLAVLTALPNSQDMAKLELALQLDFGVAWHLAAGFAPLEMEEALNRALELCQNFGNMTQYCQVLSGLSLLNFVRGNYALSRELALKTIQYGQQAEDRLLIVLGHWCLGITLFLQGEFQEARSSLEIVAAFYDPHKHHRTFVLLRGVDTGLSAMVYLACCLLCLGYPELAEQRRQETLRLAHEIGHAFTLADVLRYGGCEFARIGGDFQSLKDYAEELIELSQEKDFPAWLAAGKACLGEAMAKHGRIQEGIELIRENTRVDLSREVRCAVTGSLVSLAEIYARQGDSKHGLEALAEAVGLMERTGERYMEAEGWRVRAALERLQGDDRSAEASLQQALEVARRQHAIWLELQAALDLTQLWREQGRPEEARHLLEEVAARFPGDPDIPALEQALASCETS